MYVDRPLWRLLAASGHAHAHSKAVVTTAIRLSVDVESQSNNSRIASNGSRIVVVITALVEMMMMMMMMMMMNVDDDDGDMLCSVFQLASMDTTVLVVDNDVFVTTMCLVMLKQADASVPLEEPENVVNFVRIYLYIQGGPKKQAA